MAAQIGTSSEESQESKRPSRDDGMLVSPQWLQAHLQDRRVRVIEVDVSPAAYNDWHIDGAALWNIYSDLKDSDYHLVDSTALEQLIRNTGINSDSIVVFYGYAPALGFWVMKLCGHPDARILDCSRDGWLAAGRPRSSVGSEAAAGDFRLRGENGWIRADRAAVENAINDPDSTLVDVRSDVEYLGECFWPSGGMEPGGRAGHVPSSVHQPLGSLYKSDGSFRAPAELRHVFSRALLDGGGELITYCTIGGRAATAWFILTYLLGREGVRVYDGSWAEWGRLPDTPVMRG